MAAKEKNLGASKQAYANGLINIYRDYQDRMLKWGSRGERAELSPAVVLEAPMGQRHNPDSVLGTLNLHRKPDLSDIQIMECERVVKQLVSEGKKVENKLTYVMDSIDLSDSLKINCAIGTYFDMIGSCVSIQNEFYNHSTVATNLGELPLRERIHARNPDPILNGSARSAAIALSMLIVHQDQDGTYKYFIRRRSNKVATHAGLLHVMPSGMFQPQFELDDLRADFTIVQQAKLEYVQEFFGINDEKKFNLSDMSSVPEVGYLENLLEKGSAQLMLTGIAIALENLRPEICAVLLIHDKKWIQTVKEGTESHKKMKMNWEFEQKIPFDGKGEIGINTPLIAGLGHSTDVVPVGAAAIKMGLRAVAEELKIV